MRPVPPTHPTSTRTATIIGVALGVALLGLFVVAGLLVANWSIADFLAHLSLESVGYLLLVTVLGVATVAVPVAASLRFRLVAPLTIFGLVVAAWLGIGVTSGILSTQTVFGLALYATMLSPLYLLLYAVFGGGEYLLRHRVTG